MKNHILEFRDSPHAPWQVCRSVWTTEDVAWLNKNVGYEKYRYREV